MLGALVLVRAAGPHQLFNCHGRTAKAHRPRWAHVSQRADACAALHWQRVLHALPIALAERRPTPHIPPRRCFHRAIDLVFPYVCALRWPRAPPSRPKRSSLATRCLRLGGTCSSRPRAARSRWYRSLVTPAPCFCFSPKVAGFSQEGVEEGSLLDCLQRVRRLGHAD